MGENIWVVLYSCFSPNFLTLCLLLRFLNFTFFFYYFLQLL